MVSIELLVSCIEAVLLFVIFQYSGATAQIAYSRKISWTTTGVGDRSSHNYKAIPR